MTEIGFCDLKVRGLEWTLRIKLHLWKCKFMLKKLLKAGSISDRDIWNFILTPCSEFQQEIWLLILFSYVTAPLVCKLKELTYPKNQLWDVWILSWSKMLVGIPNTTTFNKTVYDSGSDRQTKSTSS